MTQRPIQSFFQLLIQVLRKPALLFILGLFLAITSSFYKGGSPAKPFSLEYAPDAIAKIVEIRQRPVWVKFLNSRFETSASLHMAIAPGETLKTENNALVEVKLKNDAVVRLEGDSILNFKYDRQLNLIQLDLNQGKMIIQSPEGKEKILIQMPKAIAELTRGKAYLEASAKLLVTDRVVNLDGEVKIWTRLNSKQITLQPNQLVAISAFGQFPGQMEPKLIAQADLEKFAKNQLFDLRSPRMESIATIPKSVSYPVLEPRTYDPPAYTRNAEIPSPPSISTRQNPSQNVLDMPQKTEQKSNAPEPKVESIIAPAIRSDSEPTIAPVPVEPTPEPEAN
jgi:hypothetical protein